MRSSADVTLAFVGLNPSLEGEEMQVNIPGFSGGDRTDLSLPEPQERLVQAAAARWRRIMQPTVRRRCWRRGMAAKRLEGRSPRP
jgi:hypothetical protein